MSDEVSATIGGRAIRLTHPERVLDAESGLTKADLLAHYDRVAERMLPHLAGRPLTLVRCPRGVGEDCFYQRHLDLGELPPGLEAVDTGDQEPAVRVADARGLGALVQLGVLEVHVWGSRADALDRPDRLVFDLDPGAGAGWTSVVSAARTVRERLEELGLESWAKLTGGVGLHVVAPLERRQGWGTLKAFARVLAEQLAEEAPERFTASNRKAAREGKVFLDHLRNARSATTICPFSTRARAGVSVALPLRWDELARAHAYDVRAAARRLATLKGDPWEGFFEARQSITKAARRELGLE
ncbi:MAG TPA: non-homologous end-joining DNA ligase [Polyangiaceae bacterium LLY-WYZ-15_(1-7)]|nr:DNA polymerase LigD [Myxococcales bacterium]MAT28993.1 DNA polymerase LigD [Sandaracinus sp.]HJK89424.1 non-homologous end-joining DNA ligase [Polyangiaceae bacterium LLY-WYZ-15_(1-7)]HJL04220.1 non-homologous end-joining DNA ligase [Polyangiaceae bacterium LLY-WYZ-15_(1-7)]HJL08934.1 non-homologous end-joining DNA ligase [Polyangiaceae bacterium LLY-WYZ-15_(1-7)]